MSSPLVEIVVELTEVRPDVLDAIRSAPKKLKGYKLMNQFSDVAWQRSIMALASLPGVTVEAAYQVILKAVEMTGAGAIVALVPLRDITLEECAELARQLAQRVGEHLPVYVYGAAALQPERVKLADAQAMSADAEPDFGAGSPAIFIGARLLSLTLNAILKTDNPAIAEEIAAKIGADEGGLPGVKAEAVVLRGQVIVSVTVGGFTRFPRMPLPHIVAVIQSEAQQRGANLVETEVVGLIPQHALTTPHIAAEAYMIKFTVFPEPFFKKCARMLYMTNLRRDLLLEAAIRKTRL